MFFTPLILDSFNCTGFYGTINELFTPPILNTFDYAGFYAFYALCAYATNDLLQRRHTGFYALYAYTTNDLIQRRFAAFHG